MPPQNPTNVSLPPEPIAQQARAFIHTSFPNPQSYLVITPLTSLDGQRTVLVNRGWVPLSWKERPEERVIGEPAGQVGKDGLVAGMHARRLRPRFESRLYFPSH